MMKTLSAFLSRAFILSPNYLSKPNLRFYLGSKKIKRNDIILPVMELGCNHVMQIIICIYQMKTKRMQVLHCLQYNPAAYMLQCSVNHHNCICDE